MTSLRLSSDPLGHILGIAALRAVQDGKATPLCLFVGLLDGCSVHRPGVPGRHGRLYHLEPGRVLSINNEDASDRMESKRKNKRQDALTNKASAAHRWRRVQRAGRARLRNRRKHGGNSGRGSKKRTKQKAKNLEEQGFEPWIFSLCRRYRTNYANHG